MGSSFIVPDALGTGGHLARVLEGYEAREGQLELARAIDETMRDGGTLIAEAPTGIGKSAAYGAAAIRAAVEDHRKVLIVTANIALQEQLVGKDLPLLARALPVSFSFAIAKGIRNYACLEILDAPAPRSLAHRDDYRRARDWALSTATGDLSELVEQPPFDVVERITTDSEHCLGAKDCPFAGPCHYLRAKREMHAADVVVTNYAMLYTDVAVRQATGDEATVLPPFEVLVLDEAHRATEIAREHFGFRLTQKMFERVAKGTEVGRALEAEAAELFRELDQVSRARDYKARLRRRNWHDSTGLELLLAAAAAEHVKAADALTGRNRRDRLNLADRARELAAQSSRATKLDDANVVCSAERPGGKLELKARYIDPGPLLQANLFERLHATIAVSATLAVSGKLDSAAEELGFEPTESRALSVPSPFPWGESCLLVLPEGIPEPNDDGWQEEAIAAVRRSIELASGRTLALFTSNRMLGAAADACADLGIARQGDAPRRLLVEQLRAGEIRALLGTASFWEGIDVAGEALSCVVIDRLPFPSPDDPVLDALSARDRDWFRRHSLPRAVRAFKQGFGRLIRRSTDRGVVVCLDGRLTTKPYGKTFLKSLPPIRVSRSLDDVAAFFKEHAALNEVAQTPAPMRDRALRDLASKLSLSWKDASQ